MPRIAKETRNNFIIYEEDEAEEGIDWENVYVSESFITSVHLLLL
jgi:hypothetical protein